MVFRGNFLTKVDAQGRIKIPTVHRRILEERFGPDLYVTSLTGENALIYPFEEWEQIEAKLLEPPKMHPQKVKFLRNTNYYGQVSQVDKQGRVGIQPHLRQSAHIEGEVAVMGNLNYLQVWNQEQFEQLLRTDPFTDQDGGILADMGF